MRVMAKQLAFQLARQLASGVAGTSGGGGGVVIPQITQMLFDEDFSVDKAATFAGNVAEPTSTGIGTRKWWNAKAGDNISNGVLNFDSATILIMADGATSRARNAGRCHYAAFRVTSGTDFQAMHLGLAQSDNSTGNIWFLGAAAVNTGMYTNDSINGSIRDLRDYQTSPHSNYIHRAIIPPNAEVEFCIYERGTAGACLFYRINAGDWRLGWIENISDRSGIVVLRNDGSGTGTIARRVLTADTDYRIAPIVQHSFDAALSPSDGLGQLETGGSGVAATTNGDVVIVSNKLAMNSDGTGHVVWEVGTTDWVGHVRCTVPNGSPVGVVLRWVDSSNYVYCEVDSTNDRLRLYEVVAGSPTTLATAAFNPGTTDTLNLADGADIRLVFRNVGDLIIVSMYPGALHDTIIQSATTRFNTATKCGVMVSKGAGVNSSTVEDLVIFSGVQTLPDFSAA